MGAFDRFKSADIMGVRKYIEQGTHVLLVKRTEMGQSRNPTKKNTEKTVIEFKVVESDTMRVGEMTALVEVDTSQGYYGNVLSFVAGILGYAVDEMKADPSFDEVFANVFGEEQILTGMLVRCIAQQVKTKAGGDYTAKSWEPIPASEYERYGLMAPDGAYAAAA